RKWLPAELHKFLDRRLQIAADVERDLTPQQQRQRFPTWNGMSVAKVIHTLGLPRDAYGWYGIMSLTIHGSMCMFHKSMTIDADAIKLLQRDGGYEDAIEWTQTVNRICFLGLLNFLNRDRQP